MILAVDWFAGVAQVITAVGGAGGFVAAIAAWWEARKNRLAAELAKAEAKADADAHLKILNEQTGTLARVEGNTDGALSASQGALATSQAVAEKLGIQKDALAIEVERRQANPQEPTHEGPPSAEHPVGMVGARAKAFDPTAKPQPTENP
jgi:hypothetical protein